MLSSQQSNDKDCGIYLLENARRLGQEEKIDRDPIDVRGLRLYYAKLILARSRHEASESEVLRGVLRFTKRLGSIPDCTRLKRRKLSINDIERQVHLERSEVASDVTEAEYDMPDPGINGSSGLSLTSLKQKLPQMFGRFLPQLSLCEKYLTLFSDCQVQGQSIGMARAVRLLRMVLAFGSADHLVALKKALKAYRDQSLNVQSPETTDLSTNLFETGVKADHLDLLGVVVQRLIRGHFCALIDEGVGEACAKTLVSRREVLARAIKAVAKRVLAQRAGPYQSGSLPDLFEAENTLRTWRKEGSIWSLIRNRFGSSVPLILAPRNIYMGGHPHVISGYFYQSQIPASDRKHFVEALSDLRPATWAYIPKLARLIDILSKGSGLGAYRFRLENLSDEDIRGAAPESPLLLSAFDDVVEVTE